VSQPTRSAGPHSLSPIPFPQTRSSNSTAPSGNLEVLFSSFGAEDRGEISPKKFWYGTPEALRRRSADSQSNFQSWSSALRPAVAGRRMPLFSCSHGSRLIMFFYPCVFGRTPVGCAFLVGFEPPGHLAE